ncbi:GNAT family N-acetyltransferase [Kitasatospora sp. McL0602]|uniref:GNAT family N-acetyltransferase n=1 Tax=Kitasatospora sp. McL0602 TaxID=3439530 RepID=UPI003F8AD228
MAELLDPAAELRVSFLEAVAEFRADREYPVPWFVTDIDPEALTEASAFPGYVARVLGERELSGVRADGFVAQTTLWWVEDAHVLGRLAIRHYLTPKLERLGGHIGYDVRPGARRRGHATAMLAAARPVAAALGVEEALLTCAATNTASRRVIEANGGRFVDTSGDRLRYVVPTRQGMDEVRSGRSS